MSSVSRSSCAALCAGLVFAATLLLNGCGGSQAITANNVIPVTGNWQLSSKAPAASHLASLSGELSGTNLSMTGILHTDSATACVSPSSAIEVQGSATAENKLTLTGALAGGTLAVTGTLAADGKSLSNASYTVTGGTCAFAAPADVTAQAYASITGTYTGQFADPDGNVMTITAQLTQTPNSDTDGNFQLSGTGTFPANPCFNSPVSIANSQVTGGSFNLTYTDPTTQNSVTVAGSFSPDGTSLTVSNWSLVGPCGPDSGSGLLTLTKQ